MDLVIGWISVAIIILALVVCIAGTRLFELLPTVRRFLTLSDKLAEIPITGSRFGKNPITIELAASLPVFRISPADPSQLHGFAARQLGDAMELIHIRSRRHKTTIKELSAYCVILLGLFAIAVARTQGEHRYKLTLIETVREIGAKPFEFVGLLEIVMIVFFGLRLSLELMDLRESLGRNRG